MNCLYITLFFNIVAGIVQTFIKSWNQLLYSRVIEVCRLHFETSHAYDVIAVTVAWIQECGVKPNHSRAQKLISFLCVAREKFQRGSHSFRFVIVR